MNIQETALAKALGLLKVSGATYAVMDSEGRVHISEGYSFTKIEPVEEKAKHLKTVRRGAYRKVYEPIMSSMVAGDVKVIEIPDPEWNIEFFQASVGSYAHTHWGVDSYMTKRNTDGRTISVARYL